MLLVQCVFFFVSDKFGFVDFVCGFYEFGIEFILIGGMMKYIEEVEVFVVKVVSVIGLLEIFDGCVKMLYLMIYGGIFVDCGWVLYFVELSEYGICFIDFVVVNFYLFEEMIVNFSVMLVECVEMIDIGGFCMLCVVVKNFSGVVVVVDFEDYF